MGSYYRKVNIVTSGNQSFVDPDLDVISQEDDKKYLSFRVGQPIVYDPITGKTLNAAGIATASAVRLGVGHNPKRGARMATEIRHLGGSDIDLCKSTMKIKVQAPACPTPDIKDLEFSCTKTGSDLMVVFDIMDQYTKSFYKEGAYGPLMVNLHDELDGCDTCSEEENCDRVATQIALKLNNWFLKYFPGTNKLGLNTGMPGHGIWVAKKYTNEVTFTLAASAVEDTCGLGCAVKGLKGMTATDMTALVFDDVVDPSATTQTLVEQLSDVISQINKWLGYGLKGSAYLHLADCCSYEIKVNTCLGSLAMSYHDDAAVTSESTAAFTSYTAENPYLGCGTPSSDAYVCGIRVYVDPIELPCNCEYPDGNPPSLLVRTVNISTWGDSWNRVSYRVVPVQAGTAPIGTGYDVQQNELGQSNGGEGFDYAHGIDYSQDRIPLPGKFSAVAQASVADCNDMYCIWSVVVEDHIAGSPIARHVSNAQSVSFINVPRTDTDTIDEMEEILTALADRGFCSSAVIECIPASS